MRKAKATANVYGDFLWAYWSKSLALRLPSPRAWLDELQMEHGSKDLQIRQRWASDLEDSVTSYVSPVTSKHYTFKSRKIFVTAVRSSL